MCQLDFSFSDVLSEFLIVITTTYVTIITKCMLLLQSFTLNNTIFYIILFLFIHGFKTSEVGLNPCSAQHDYLLEIEMLPCSFQDFSSASYADFTDTDYHFLGKVSTLTTDNTWYRFSMIYQIISSREVLERKVILSRCFNQSIPLFISS